MTGDAMSGKKQVRNGIEDNDSDGDRQTLREQERKPSRYENSVQKPASHRRVSSKEATHGRSFSSVSRRASIGEQLHLTNDEDDRPNFTRARMHEVDEFTTREDLRSWKISTNEGGR